MSGNIGKEGTNYTHRVDMQQSLNGGMFSGGWVKIEQKLIVLLIDLWWCRREGADDVSHIGYAAM